MRNKIFYAENADVYPGIVAKNNAVLEYEKFVHRTYYPNIIHPYSYFRVTWEKCVMALILTRLFFVSIIWSAVPHGIFAFQVPVLCFQVLNLVDVIVNFHTGYIDSSTETAVLEPRRIAKKYLTTYFIVDVLPCLPVETIFLMFTVEQSTVVYWEVIFDGLNHLMYLRYFTFLRYYQNIAKIMLWNVFLVGLVSIALGVLFVLIIANNLFHILCAYEFSETCRKQWHQIGFMPHSFETFWHYISTYFDGFVFLVFDCIFFESRIPRSYEYIRIFVLISSFFSNILFCTFFIKYVMLKMVPKEKFLDLESRVLTFVRMKHLPRTIEYKTLLYFQTILENKAYREDEIFNYIPDSFKADIFFHLCLPLLKHFYAFEDFPTYVFRRLAECMQYQLYLPNEVVLRKDEPILGMYFVHRGTVALYASNHVELYHFEGGSSFNGRNMVLGITSVGYYAISIEVAEVYKLDHKNFVQIMKSYPNLYKAVKQKALQDKSGESYMGR